MSGYTATVLTATGGADLAEAFYAIIGEDPELLRAEFDDLTDAAWDDPPAGPPASPEEHRSRARSGGYRQDRWQRPRREDDSPPRRQRSPPGRKPPE